MDIFQAKRMTITEFFNTSNVELPVILVEDPEPKIPDLSTLLVKVIEWSRIRGRKARNPTNPEHIKQEAAAWQDMWDDIELMHEYGQNWLNVLDEQD